MVILRHRGIHWGQDAVTRSVNVSRVTLPARLVRGTLRTSLPLLVTAVALVTAAGLYVRFGSSNLARLASDDMLVHVDFETFHRSAVALVQGSDLYRTGAALPNLNPPLVSVLLAPLAWLPPLPAYHVFALLTAVLVLGCVAAVAEEVRLRPAWTLVTGVAVLASSPMHGTLVQGQVYGLLTAALTVAWLAERRGRPELAGVAIGLAAAIKPSLLPLLLLPALHRRWTQVASAVAAGAVATAVGLLAAGWAATRDWVALLAAVEVDGFLDNDSLAALAVRFGAPAVLGHLVAALLLVLTLWRVRDQPELALWAATASALLLAPIAWNNYLVLLAPALPILLARGRAVWALPLLALPLIGIDWSSLWTEDSYGTRLAYSLYCGMLLAYWVVLVAGLPRRASGEPGPVRLTDPVRADPAAAARPDPAAAGPARADPGPPAAGPGR
jgi:hypothetical protein